MWLCQPPDWKSSLQGDARVHDPPVMPLLTGHGYTLHILPDRGSRQPFRASGPEDKPSPCQELAGEMLGVSVDSNVTPLWHFPASYFLENKWKFCLLGPPGRCGHATIVTRLTLHRNQILIGWGAPWRQGLCFISLHMALRSFWFKKWLN